MDINYFSFCFVFVKITDVHSTLLYSGSELYSYEDGKSACSNLGGSVLQYGMDFVNATIQCNQHSYIWIGLPFYNQLRGCYKGSFRKSTPPNEDMRIAICSDFCSDNSFTHFGIMTTECHCFTQPDFDNLEHTYNCQYPSCPGNTYDMCGVSPYSIVFQKETQYDFLSCQSRQVLQTGESHEVTRYCGEKLPVWCKVGDSINVQCSFEQPTTERTTNKEQTTTEMVSSSHVATDADLVTTTQSDYTTSRLQTDLTSEMTSDILITTEIQTTHTTTDFVTNEKSSTVQHEVSTETVNMNHVVTTASRDDSVNVLSQRSTEEVKQGTIIGVTCVAVALISIFVIVLVVRFRRKRKEENTRNHQYPEVNVYFTNISESQRPDSYEHNWSTEDNSYNDNSYDSYGYSRVNKFKHREPMYDQEILFMKTNSVIG